MSYVLTTWSIVQFPLKWLHSLQLLDFRHDIYSGKDPEAGRDWGQEEKGTTEDEMAGWHHRLNRHEFE